MPGRSFLKSAWEATTRSGPEFEGRPPRVVTPEHAREARWMRASLFWVFLVLFVGVCACTMLTVFAGLGSPTEAERSMLFKGFMVQIGAAVIALFYSAFGLRRAPESGEPPAKPAVPGQQSSAVEAGDTKPHRDVSLNETLWSRSMPRLELGPPETVAELHRVLERIRQRACERVRRFHSRVTPANFRVHVVLPDYSQFEELGTHLLFLPKALRVGDHTGDEALRVWPGQGVGGRVFATQATETVRIAVGEDGIPRWPDEFVYTETYKSSIPTDLRWLAAFPLRVPGEDQQLETLGVLGIQGLKHELTEDQMDAVIGFLLSDVLIVAARTSMFSRVRITVLKVDVPDRR